MSPKDRQADTKPLNASRRENHRNHDACDFASDRPDQPPSKASPRCAIAKSETAKHGRADMGSTDVRSGGYHNIGDPPVVYYQIW